MDYFYQQKLINEKNNLQQQINKANLQLNELKNTAKLCEDVLNSVEESYMPDKKESFTQHDPKKGVYGGPKKDESFTKHNPKKGVWGGPEKIEIKDKIVNKLKLRESHTHSELIKLSKKELENLKAEYEQKAEKENKAGNKEKAKEHEEELNDINSILDKKINEELLNEIGDTPAGQRALKLVRSRAKAEVEWDKTVGTNFAKQYGSAEDMEKVKKKIAEKEKVISQANKRIKPSKMDEAFSNKLNQIKTKLISGINKVVDNMPSNKTLVNFAKDAVKGTAVAMQNEKQNKLSKKKSNENLHNLAGHVGQSAINRIAIDQRHKKVFKKP